MLESLCCNDTIDLELCSNPVRVLLVVGLRSIG